MSAIPLKFTVDSRGHLAKYFSLYFDAHPIIAKRYHMEVVGNQAQDFKCLNPSMVREVKLSAHDLHDLTRLEKELLEVYLPDPSDYRYLDLVFDEDAVMLRAKAELDNKNPQGYYLVMKELWDFWRDLRIVMGLMDRFFPMIRLKIYKRPDLLIKGILDTLDHPPSYIQPEAVPIDLRDQEKGMILSLSSRMNGITPTLAKFIWEYEEDGKRVFTSERNFYFAWDTESIGCCKDIHPTTESELIELFERIFREFYKIKTDQIGANGLPIYKYIEKHELARKFAHTFFQEYGGN